MHRQITILAASAALFVAQANVAIAAKATVGGVSYTYFLSGGKATIGDGKTAAIPKSKTGAVSVPSKLGGCPVTAIAPYAFYECAISSATLPSGVKSIGEWAFRECHSLKSVSLPASITSIDAQAFGNTGLTSIILPAGLQKLNSEVLDACDYLKSVTFPAGLTEVEPWAIMDCHVLTDFTFLGNAPNFPDDALYYCPTSSITVHVPKGSTGWGVSIPGMWKGMKIIYSKDESSSKKTYMVKFNSNGGKGKMAAQTMTYGKSAKLRKNKFTRSGYVFIGWARKKNGPVIQKDNALVENLAATGKTTNLYAQWAKKTYKVKFLANGGKGKMAVQKFTYGKTKKLSANKFTRKGYTFQGWSKKKNGAVAYGNKAKVKNLNAKGKTVKLYAVWKKKGSSSWCEESSSSSQSSSKDMSYHVLFNANGGAGKMYEQLFGHDESKALSANAFEHPGFVFAGWSKTSGGAVAYTDKQVVRNLSSGATVKLYAVWRDDPSNPVTTLSFCGLQFVTDTAAAWSATSVDSVPALVSAPVGDNGKSTLYLTVTGPGTISFKMRAISEVGKDKLVFRYPSSTAGVSYSVSTSSISESWIPHFYTIPSGTHILTWTYEKDASGSYGPDCGWIADVVWSK